MSDEAAAEYIIKLAVNALIIVMVVLWVSFKFWNKRP